MAKNKRKPLVELESFNGKVKRFWESGKDAADFYGFSPVFISYVVTGKAKHAKKKYFRYATEQEISSYNGVQQRITADEDTGQSEEKQVVDLPNITVEIIPEKVEKPTEDLTPFDKLLNKGRENLI